jgi:hypothetical protein
MPDSHCLRFCAVMVSFELAIYIAWALAVVSYDCLRRRIPNAPIAAGALCALALSLARLSPLDTAPDSALIGAALGGVALLLFCVHRDPRVAPSGLSVSAPSAAHALSGTPYGALLALAPLGYLALHALERRP